MFLAKSVVGAAYILHPLAILQLDPFADEGSTAITAGDQAAVAVNGLSLTGADIVFLSHVH